MNMIVNVFVTFACTFCFSLVFQSTDHAIACINHIDIHGYSKETLSILV